MSSPLPSRILFRNPLNAIILIFYLKLMHNYR